MKTRNMFVKIAEKIEWNKQLHPIRKWIRIVISSLIILTSLLYLSLSIAVPEFTFSPMILFYFTFLLSFLLIWVALGLKEENIKVCFWLFILFVINIGLHVGAACVDLNVKFLIVSLPHQLIAMIVIVLIWTITVLKKKTRLTEK